MKCPGENVEHAKIKNLAVVEMLDTIKDPSTGKVTGVHALDRMTGKTFEIHAQRVIFAGGPFTDSLRKMEFETEVAKENMQPAVRGASGTHIVLPAYYCPNEVRSSKISASETFVLSETMRYLTINFLIVFLFVQKSDSWVILDGIIRLQHK